jgi:hemerythrin-like domain-containing protein
MGSVSGGWFVCRLVDRVERRDWPAPHWRPGSPPQAEGLPYSEQVLVVGGVEAEAFHLAGQVGADGFGRGGDPGGDDGLDADAALAIVFGQTLGGSAKLGFGFFAHGAGRLRQYLLEQVVSGIVPVHFRYSSRQAMLRDPSLIPLSHQHHNGLALCVMTRRSLREDATQRNVAKLARRAVDRYELELANHFEIEEQILFPAIEGALGPQPLVAELTAEHRELERMIAGLRSEPAAALLEQFCTLLNDHIRREENELFQTVQARLPEATLRALGETIDGRVVRICFS